MGLMAMKDGLPQREAIRLAGETRMQPILMTTIAMIAGMLPIALGLGAGSEVRSPMAISVIGGLDNLHLVYSDCNSGCIYLY